MDRRVERISLLVLREVLRGGGALLVVVLDEGVQTRTRSGRAKDDQMISAVALLALFAIDHWVVKPTYMAGGDPCFGVHDDRAVDADDVDRVSVRSEQFALDDIVPPRVFQVPLEACAKRSVIPKPVDASVDLGGLEDEATAPAERDNVVHLLRGGRNRRGCSDFRHVGLDRGMRGAQDIGRRPRENPDKTANAARCPLSPA